MLVPSQLFLSAVDAYNAHVDLKKDEGDIPSPASTNNQQHREDFHYNKPTEQAFTGILAPDTLPLGSCCPTMKASLLHNIMAIANKEKDKSNDEVNECITGIPIYPGTSLGETLIINAVIFNDIVINQRGVIEVQLPLPNNNNNNNNIVTRSCRLSSDMQDNKHETKSSVNSHVSDDDVLKPKTSLLWLIREIIQKTKRELTVSVPVSEQTLELNPGESDSQEEQDSSFPGKAPLHVENEVSDILLSSSAQHRKDLLTVWNPRNAIFLNTMIRTETSLLSTPTPSHEGNFSKGVSHSTDDDNDDIDYVPSFVLGEIVPSIKAVVHDKLRSCGADVMIVPNGEHLFGIGDKYDAGVCVGLGGTQDNYDENIAAFLKTVTLCLAKTNTSACYITFSINKCDSDVPGNSLEECVASYFLPECECYGLCYAKVAVMFDVAIEEGELKSQEEFDVSLRSLNRNIASEKDRLSYVACYKLMHRFDEAGLGLTSSTPITSLNNGRGDEDGNILLNETCHKCGGRKPNTCITNDYKATASQEIDDPTVVVDEERDSKGVETISSLCSNSNKNMISNKRHYPYAIHYDVVIQGTGLAESFLSAALARAGKRVLHLDAAEYYGGTAFQSPDLLTFHQQRGYTVPGVSPVKGKAVGSDMSSQYITSNNCDGEFKCFRNRVGLPHYDDEASGKDDQLLLNLTFREKREVVVDMLPLFHFAHGNIVNALVEADATKSLEFMSVERVLLIEKTAKPRIIHSTVENNAIGEDSKSKPNGGGISIAARLKAARAQKQQKISKSECVSEMPISTATDDIIMGIKKIPFSRSDIFKSSITGLTGILSGASSSLFSSPLEMRRVTKFIRDIERAFGQEECHSGNENNISNYVCKDSGDSEMVDASNDVHRKRTNNVLCPWNSPDQDPNEPIAAFLQRHYGLSSQTVDLMLIGRLLSVEPINKSDNSPKTQKGQSLPLEGDVTNDISQEQGGSLKQSIDLIKTALSSVGYFGPSGETPFLCPLYGVGELPQSLCRMSAVWDSVFVLRRYISRIEVLNGEGCDGSAAKLGDSSNAPIAVYLSNGERVVTSCCVVPRELPLIIERRKEEKASNGINQILPYSTKENTTAYTCDQNQCTSAKLHRAVLLTTQPLATWAMLEERCSDIFTGENEEEIKTQTAIRDRYGFPLAALVIQYQDGVSGCKVPIMIHQLNTSTGHVPEKITNDPILMNIPEKENGGDVEKQKTNTKLCLLHFTADARKINRESFDNVVNSLINTVPSNPAEVQMEGSSSSPKTTLIEETSVLYQAHFTLDSTRCALRSGGNAPLRVVVGDSSLGKSMNTSPPLPEYIKTIGTIVNSANESLIDDGVYAREAKRVYEAIFEDDFTLFVKRQKKYECFGRDGIKVSDRRWQRPLGFMENRAIPQTSLNCAEGDIIPCVCDNDTLGNEDDANLSQQTKRKKQKSFNDFLEKRLEEVLEPNRSEL